MLRLQATLKDSLPRFAASSRPLVRTALNAAPWKQYNLCSDHEDTFWRAARGWSGLPACGNLNAGDHMSAARLGTDSPVNSPRQVLFASLVGTTIEFFDFYIYATAAVLVFPKLFFPAVDPAAATLASFATFGIAFLARPIGSALFGHFGDRIGRKTTLVVALATMGISTVAIGALPTYATIGFAAPLLLAICRFGQGLGLGGEWGGAVLLAIENAPPNKRAWYGMFPQLGAPLGFFLSGGTFLALSQLLTDKQFFAFGWRLPFLASAVLVFLGLYVRLTINETPVFQQALKRGEQVRLPVLAVFRHHTKALVAGILLSISAFVIFYLMTVFALSWGTSVLGYSRGKFLLMQLFGISFFSITIPVSALLAERGRRRAMLWITTAIFLFGLIMAPMFAAGTGGALGMLTLGLSLMGLTYGPLGTVVSELFPTPVRYSGSSLAFNFAGILGASLAPYIATWLARNYGLRYVGYYLSASAFVSFMGLLAIRETKDDDISAGSA
jgi:metabolite-proton symporter